MYDNRCECCGGVLQNLSFESSNEDWEMIYSQIALEILKGTASDVNADLHLKTASKLMDGVYSGLGGYNLAYDDDRAVLANYLQRNIYAFSSAKSFTEMLQYRDSMIGTDGKILGYNSFRKVIADQGEVFNERYLRAEYENANYSTIMAHKWETLTSEYLEYTTVGDNRVRPEHQKLDKFTALKTDPVWNRIYPPLAFGCRCSAIPGKEQNVDKVMTSIEASTFVKPLVKGTTFDNNVGKSKIIFTENHPYFQSAKGSIHELSWEQYGLKSLDKIRTEQLPEFVPTTKEQYFDWWKNQPKFKGDDFTVKDALNQEILLASGEGKKSSKSNYYKDHILQKSEDNRYKYATESISILKQPDEIWNSYTDKNSRVYIKYYEDFTLKLVVNEKLEAVTLYDIKDRNTGELERSRKGILLYKK